MGDESDTQKKRHQAAKNMKAQAELPVTESCSIRLCLWVIIFIIPINKQ
jgi:hypothetical protein